MLYIRQKQSKLRKFNANMHNDHHNLFIIINYLEKCLFKLPHTQFQNQIQDNGIKTINIVSKRIIIKGMILTIVINSN